MPSETVAGSSSNEPTTDESAVTPGPGPGQDPIGKAGITAIAIYLILSFLFLSYLLVKVWPHCLPVTPPASQPQTSASPAGGSAAPQPTTGGQAKAESPCDEPARIAFFWNTGDSVYWVWYEVRLLLIVMIAGALGAWLHSARSLFWYVGNRDLRWSWLLMYLLLPFSGAILALILYLIIRGGFFPQAKADQSSPISFAALAALMGLFSGQAALKLKQIFETMLTAPSPGAENKSQPPSTPGQPTSGPVQPPPSGPATSPPSGPVTSPPSGPVTSPPSGPGTSPPSGLGRRPPSGPGMSPPSGPGHSPP